MYKLYFKLKKQFKLEKDFTTAFLKEFKDQWWWAYKISDLRRTIKPFDCIMINWEWVFFCEIKTIEHNIFKFNQLRNNQFTRLTRISNIVDKYNLPNIHPIVIVYSLKFHTYKVIDFKDILKAIEKGKEELSFLF